jgi:hypothetical protein
MQEAHGYRMGEERWPKIAWKFKSVGRYVEGSQETLEGLFRERYKHCLMGLDERGVGVRVPVG